VKGGAAASSEAGRLYWPASFCLLRSASVASARSVRRVLKWHHRILPRDDGSAHVPEFEIKGVKYLSTKEAAAQLGVKPPTLRGYHARGILPEPDRVRVGRRVQRGYTEKYLQEAAQTLASYGG
jgi:MerR family regulatory protein